MRTWRDWPLFLHDHMIVCYGLSRDEKYIKGDHSFYTFSCYSPSIDTGVIN